MKQMLASLALCVVAVPAFAQKPCAELKTEIAARIDKQGVRKYQLDIVPAADVKQQKIVGSCEGGTRKIAYTKG
jgi:hypothetical protein